MMIEELMIEVLQFLVDGEFDLFLGMDEEWCQSQQFVECFGFEWVDLCYYCVDNDFFYGVLFEFMFWYFFLLDCQLDG